MTSRRLQILEGVVAVLNGAGKPPDVPAARKRRPAPGERTKALEINVYDGGDTVTVIGGRHGPAVERAQIVMVEARGVTDDFDVIDSLLDPLYVWAVQAIMGSGELGGEALSIEERGSEPEPQYLERYYPILRIVFVVQHKTSRRDPTARF